MISFNTSKFEAILKLLSSLFGLRKRSYSKQILFLLLILLFVFLIFSLIQPSPQLCVEKENVFILTDDNYFPYALSSLVSANKSIHMVMYSLNYYPDHPDSKVNMLIDQLALAVERGVDVRIVVDEYATEKPVLTMLKNKGINIKYDSKNKTTHAKLIIIDENIIIIGSTNWSYYALEKNHETSLLIKSQNLAKEMERYFEKIWLET